jgi:hypothetical protein
MNHGINCWGEEVVDLPITDETDVTACQVNVVVPVGGV